MMPWIIASGALLGTYLVGSKRRVGWLVNLSVQMLYIIWGANTQQWGFVAGGFVFSAIILRNYFRWRKQDLQNSDQKNNDQNNQKDGENTH